MADILLVFHPCSGRRPRQAEVESIRARLAADGHTVETLATVPGPASLDLVARHLGKRAWSIVVAAGGDGTIRDVAEALLAQPMSRRPSLVLVAMGTANNAARSIDPAQSRSTETTVDRVARVVGGGIVREVDVGRANGHAFVGSVAVGMDADILVWRNAMRPRVPASIGGYPLYLASCAINALRRHGGSLRLGLVSAPGGEATLVDENVVNVLVANTGLYAGEFHFAGGPRHEDGLFDVLWNQSMGDYLRRYAAAWPRHLRAARGLSVRDDAGLRSAFRLTMEWPSPMAWQLDGEEMAPTSRFDIEMLPGALRVLVAASA